MAADDFLSLYLKSQKQATTPDVSTLLDQMRPATSGQESSGNARAVNPRTKASGEFQVLPENIGPWTQTYLNRRLTTEQFMADPEAQRRVFDGEMGKYLRKAKARGVDDDTAIRMAAAGWYGGEGAMDRFDDDWRPKPDEPSFREYTSSVLNRARKARSQTPVDFTSAYIQGIAKNGGPSAAEPVDFTDAYIQDQKQGPTKPGVPPIGFPTVTPTNPVQPAKVSAVQPMPEPIATLEQQLLSTRDSGSPKAATLITDPAQIKFISPDAMQGFERVDTPNGVLFVNPVKAKALGVTDYTRDLAKLIGKVEDRGNDTASGLALTTKDAEGNELSTSIVSPQNIQSQAAVDRAMFPHAASQEVVNPQDVVDERAERLTHEAQAIAESAVQNQRAAQVQQQKAQTVQRGYSEADFDAWAKYKKLPKTAEARKSFESELSQAGKEGFGKGIEIQANPGDFKVDENGQQVSVTDPGFSQVGATKADRNFGKATDDLDREIATTTVEQTAAPEEKMRLAMRSQLARFGVTDAEIERYIKSPAGQRDAGQIKPNINKIAVSFRVLKDIKGEDEARFQIRNEQSQSRVNQLTPEEMHVGKNWTSEDAEWLNSNAGKALTAINPLFSFLSDDQKKAVEDVNEQAGRKVLAPIVGGVLGSGARTWRALAGIARPINTSLYEYMKEVADTGEGFEKRTGDDGVVSMLARVAGGAPGDLSRLVLLTRAGGVIIGMAAETGLQSSGRGDTPGEVARQTAKGAVLGGVFKAAPIIGKLGEYAVSGTFKGAIAGAIARETATLGAIGLGSAQVEKSFGATDEQAVHTAIVNSLFHLTSLGLNLRGKFIRARTPDGTKVNAGVDPDGNIRLLKGQDVKPDIEMYVDVAKGADGVYRTPGDTAPVREREVRLGEDRMLRAPRERGNPLEQPGPSETPTPLRTSETEAMRIDNPDPAAIQAASVDTRVRKVADALKGKDFQTVEEIAKATRINKTNVEDAVMTLYGAGQVELLSDNRVRLVDESATEKQNSLIERAKNYGKTPQTPVSQSPAPLAQSENVPGEQPPAPEKRQELLDRVKNALAALGPEESAKLTEGYDLENATPTQLRDIMARMSAPKFTEQQKQQAAASEGLTTGERSPEQQRRDAGEYTKDGVTYQRQPVIENAPEGNKGKVKFADAEKPDFTYRLIEAGQLQPVHINGVPNPQHFIPEAQPKVRTDKASLRAADRIAENIDFGELGESPNAYSGSPIVNSRGEAVQGNNRSAGIKLHYAKGGTKYKDELASNAGKFGFTPEQVRAMKEPVLVRSLDVDDDKAIELGNYDSKDTESGGTHRIEADKLVKRIPHEEKAAILDDIFRNAGPDETLNQIVRNNDTLIKKYLDPYLTDTQKQSMFDSDGTMTPTAVADIEEAFKHFLFAGGDNNLPRLFSELPDAVQKGLTASLPKIFGVPEESSLVPEIQNAIGAYNTFAESGLPKFQDWAKQANMFLDGMAPADFFTPTELAIAQKLSEAKKQSEVKAIFADYAKLANAFEGDLFEEPRPARSKAEAVKEIFDVEHREREGGDKPTLARERSKPESSDATTEDEKGSDSRVLPEPDGETRDQAVEPATERSQRRESLTQTPPQELTPLMTARVKYALERKMTPSDIAERYNLTPEQVESVKPLEPVGASGQTSYKLRQNFLPSRTPTDAEIAEKTAMINDLAGFLNVPDARVSRDTGQADMATAFDLIRLTIAKSFGRDRGSQMTRADWDTFLDGAGTALEYNTIAGIVDALNHQADWSQKASGFVNDTALHRMLDELDDRFGLANIEDFSKLPLQDRKAIIALGEKHGLKKHAIAKAFSDTFLELAREESEKGTDRPGGQEGPATGEAKTVERRSSESEELKSKEDTSISPWKTPEGRAEMAQARRKAIIEEYGLDTETDADIIAALENAGDILFNQTDLFGNIVDEPVSQPSIFDMALTEADQKAAVEREMSKAYGPGTARFIASIADSPNKNLSRVARELEDARKIVLAKGENARQIVEDAADALDIYARALQTKTPIDDMLRQGWIGGDVELSEQAKRFAKAMDSGVFAKGIKLALSRASNEQVLQSADLGQPQTETEAFKKWFGDSKVVDKDGKPLVVFTGNHADFDVFRIGKEGGIFFSPSGRIASGYAEHIRNGKLVLHKTEDGFRGANVIPAYLAIQNPKIIDFHGQIVERIKPRIEKAKRDGYDGLIIKNGKDFQDPLGAFDQYVVFSPTQIKSAIGNKGTFDPNEDSILMQPAWHGSSRSKGEGNYNYVIFDDADVEIMEVSYAREAQKERPRLARHFKETWNKDDAAVLEDARITVNPENGLAELNEDGLVATIKTMRRIGMVRPDGGFIGSYLTKPQASELKQAANNMLKFVEANGNDREIAAVTNYVRQLSKAIDPKHGDISMAFQSPDFPATSKFTAQEELSHRADKRLLTNTNIAEAMWIDGYRDAARHLRRNGYPNANRATIHREISAKVFRDDAADALGITWDQADKIQAWYRSNAIKEHVTADDVRREFGKISKRADRFIEEYEQGRSTGTDTRDRREPDSGGEGEVPGLLRSTGEVRRGGGTDRNPADARTKDRPDLERLRQASILSADRSRNESLISPADRRFIERASKGNTDLQRALEDEVLFSTSNEPWTVGGVLIDLTNAPKAIKSSVDMSAAGRQGLIVSLANPTKAFRAFGRQLRAMTPVAGAKYYENFKRDLDLDPYIELMEESGLYLGSLASESAHMNAREEAFMSRLLGEDKVFSNKKLETGRKLLTAPIRISERGYLTYLDSIRSEVFKKLANEIHNFNRRTGRPDEIEQYQGIAEWINFATGRGNVGSLDSAVPALNAAWWSVRYWASRLQVMNPFFYAKLPPGARSIAMREMAKYVAAVGVAMVIAKLAGFEVEWDDPNDPDTLKIGFGKYKADVTGGLIQHLRYVARMALATQADNPADRMTFLTERYVRSKLAPVPGGVWNAASGTNYIGEPTGWKEETAGLLVPLSVDNFTEAAKAEGLPGIVKMSPEFFGISVTRYKDSTEIEKRVSDAQKTLENAKTDADRKEAMRRLKAWQSLYRRARKYEAEESQQLKSQ